MTHTYVTRTTCAKSREYKLYAGHGVDTGRGSHVGAYGVAHVPHHETSS